MTMLSSYAIEWFPSASGRESNEQTLKTPEALAEHPSSAHRSFADFLDLSSWR